MRAIVILSLMLAGCNSSDLARVIKGNEKFKVGDCIQSNYFREEWEAPPSIWKIIGIGKLHYKSLTEYGSIWSYPPIGFEDGFNKVECPK